ncbi:hypothetical protein GWI33_016292 [Rhynchophorus ferrugineus]|uniref:GPI mannosyltransferase 2 n=1 Tax=Rhynchophorus ferrugineus TaxID=354439 RepID=A0A834I1J9_RHYFE|nr:hypothetical protein GWI33_016292 [Rhynchophorus ferrugineus]
MKNEDKLTQLAYFSRIFLIVLQFLANQAIPDHDAKVFQYLAEKNTTKYDKIIEYLFGGFIRWDAQYFMHISNLKHLYINIVQRKLVFWFFTMENPTKIAKNKIQYDKADLYQPKLTVSTRLLCSASPVFYWICSKHLNLLKLPSKSDTLKELYLRTYYVSFFIAGTLLFCNFLPWT